MPNNGSNIANNHTHDTRGANIFADLHSGEKLGHESLGDEMDALAVGNPCISPGQWGVLELGRLRFRNLSIEIALKGVTWLGSYYPFLAFCLLVALQVD